MTSTILGSLTLVLLAASIFIGLKNKTMYEERIQTRIEEDSKNVRKTASLQSVRDEKNKTSDERTQKESDAEALGKTLDEQKKKNDELVKQIDQKKDQIAAQKLKIEQVVEALKELGNIEELIPKVKSLKNSIVQLNADIDAEKVKLSGLVGEQKRTAAIISGYEVENSWRSAVASNPQLNTRIGRIYESHGFVSLPVGNTSGVVSGSTLEVVRDGGIIAKILVKAVEATSSAAELIPGSLTPETVLMEGDAVRSSAVVTTTAPEANAVAPIKETAPELPANEEPAAAPAVDALEADAPAEAAAPADAIFE